mmetsp:Transcript_151789/g.368590  ORF Transcript_151789/g.368590 Transcript_151789/m.368590 type:complete len:392 (-) Transcript_151789:10-1185(-)
MPFRRGGVEAAPHAHNRLRALAHGKLLQMVVGLEHDVSHTGPAEPGGLEALDLPQVLGLRGGPLGQVLDVQGEERLPALLQPHTDRQGEVLQVHGSGGVERGLHAHCRGVLQRQAAQAPGRSPRHELRLPANAVLLPLPQLHGSISPAACLLVRPRLPQHELRLALAVQRRLPARGRVGLGARGQPALRAERQLLAVRVHQDLGLRPRRRRPGGAGPAGGGLPGRLDLHGEAPGLLRLQRAALAEGADWRLWLRVALHWLLGALGRRGLLGLPDRLLLGLLFRLLALLQHHLLAADAGAHPARARPFSRNELEAKPPAARVEEGLPHDGADGEALGQLGRGEVLLRTHQEAITVGAAQDGPVDGLVLLQDLLWKHHGGLARGRQAKLVPGL